MNSLIHGTRVHPIPSPSIARKRVSLRGQLWLRSGGSYSRTSAVPQETAFRGVLGPKGLLLLWYDTTYKVCLCILHMYKTKL